MENQTSQEIKNLTERVNSAHKRIDKVDTKVEKIEENFNQHRLDMVELTTALKGDSKASRDSNDRLTKSIDGLVEEMKESNKNTGQRFERIENKINQVESIVNDKTLAVTAGLEEKKMSKTMITSIIVAILGLVGVLAKVVAPLLVG